MRGRIFGRAADFSAAAVSNVVKKLQRDIWKMEKNRRLEMRFWSRFLPLKKRNLHNFELFSKKCLTKIYANDILVSAAAHKINKNAAAKS